jgi:CheY-like chemotaxis protein
MRSRREPRRRQPRTPPPRRVLVVDDDADTRRYLCAVLGEALGSGVDVAADGRSALARAARVRPDLVLLDLGLPDLSGVTVARLLRQDPATRTVPIVGVSGLIRADDGAARALGFDAVLPKPVASDALAACVRSLLEAGDPAASA